MLHAMGIAQLSALLRFHTIRIGGDWLYFMRTCKT